MQLQIFDISKNSISNYELSQPRSSLRELAMISQLPHIYM